jgi:hypothetical protein
VIGAERADRHAGGVREFLAAKRHAELVLQQLQVPWTCLRFGALTEAPGDGRIDTAVEGGQKLTLSRDDAALVVAEALVRSELVRQVVPVIDGDRKVGNALDAIRPLPLPDSGQPPTGRAVPLGAAQSDNPPDAPNMIASDAAPLDADVEWEGDGPVPVEPVGNDDPAPGIP